MGYQLPLINHTYQNYAMKLRQSNSNFKTFRTVRVKFYTIGEDDARKMPDYEADKIDVETSISHLTMEQKAKLTGKGMYYNWQI